MTQARLVQQWADGFADDTARPVAEFFNSDEVGDYIGHDIAVPGWYSRLESDTADLESDWLGPFESERQALSELYDSVQYRSNV